MIWTSGKPLRPSPFARATREGASTCLCVARRQVPRWPDPSEIGHRRNRPNRPDSRDRPMPPRDQLRFSSWRRSRSLPRLPSGGRGRSPVPRSSIHASQAQPKLSPPSQGHAIDSAPPGRLVPRGPPPAARTGRDGLRAFPCRVPLFPSPKRPAPSGSATRSKKPEFFPAQPAPRGRPEKGVTPIGSKRQASTAEREPGTVWPAGEPCRDSYPGAISLPGVDREDVDAWRLHWPSLGVSPPNRPSESYR